MKIIEAIDKTIEWLRANPSNRILNGFARSHKGKSVPANSPGAIEFCTLAYLSKLMNWPCDHTYEVRLNMKLKDRDAYEHEPLSLVYNSNDGNDIASIISALENLKRYV